jgi:hypothetical protein
MGIASKQVDSPLLQRSGKRGHYPTPRRSPDKPAISSAPSRWVKLHRQILALIIATFLWVPSLHLMYAGSGARFVGGQTSHLTPALSLERSGGLALRPSLSPTAQALLAWQIHVLDTPSLRGQQRAAMRKSNPEWDFMGRTYLVWALGNIALRDPSRKQACLAQMDSLIDDTVALERERGLYYFLMPYAQNDEFVQRPAGSQFVDGETALMLGMRRIVEEKPAYKVLQQALVNRIIGRMTASRPTVSAESYPDECWTFCNVVALDAVKTEDYLDGTDHTALFHAWLTYAHAHLIDTRTGLLISAYTTDGDPIYGPEGSSIWMVCHGLDLIDPAFAKDQYVRARRTLVASAAGFTYAREWPPAWRGSNLIDSGVVLPGLDASPGSTGMALLAAATFHDRTLLNGLAATMDFAAFPIHAHVPETNSDGLHYAAGNQVSDAVFLYASVLGPMWDKIAARHH